jgi:hypothetical protein
LDATRRRGFSYAAAIYVWARMTAALDLLTWLDQQRITLDRLAQDQSDRPGVAAAHSSPRGLAKASRVLDVVGARRCPDRVADRVADRDAVGTGLAELL